MAMTAAAVASFDGANLRAYDITATLDADTTVTIDHDLGFVPTEVMMAPLQASCYIGLFRVSNTTSTQFVITKGTAAGSGAVGPAVRFYFGRPQSICK